MIIIYKIMEILTSSIIHELNKKLGGAWYHIENVFGILKARFQIFKQTLKCSHEDVRHAIILTSSTIILHNFLIEVNDDLIDVLQLMIENEYIRNEDNDDVEEDISTRVILFRHVRYLIENWICVKEVLMIRLRERLQNDYLES